MRCVEEFQLKSFIYDQIVLFSLLMGLIVVLVDVFDLVFFGGMFGDGIGIDLFVGWFVVLCVGVVLYFVCMGYVVMIMIL